jgi:hypothetical protein
MANLEGKVTCMTFLLLFDFLLLTEVFHTKIKEQCKVNDIVVLCGIKQDANYT